MKLVFDHMIFTWWIICYYSVTFPELSGKPWNFISFIIIIFLILVWKTAHYCWHIQQNGRKVVIVNKKAMMHQEFITRPQSVGEGNLNWCPKILMGLIRIYYSIRQPHQVMGACPCWNGGVLEVDFSIHHVLHCIFVQSWLKFLHSSTQPSPSLAAFFFALMNRFLWSSNTLALFEVISFIRVTCRCMFTVI